MVLQGLELGLGERIVIRDLRSAQRAGHPEIGEELSRALARHRSSSIRVQGQDPGLDAMLQATLLDQAPGQGRALPIRHHPSHDVAAEDVHDDVEVEVAPLPRPQQPCDIPGPDLAPGPSPSTRVSGIRDDSAALGALELALGRPERDTSYVRCTGRRLRRAGSPQPRPGTGPRIAPNTACRRPCLVPSRSRHGLGSGGAADARPMASDDDRTRLGRP